MSVKLIREIDINYAKSKVEGLIIEIKDEQPENGPLGYYKPDENKLVIFSKNRTTFYHELAHAVLLTKKPELNKVLDSNVANIINHAPEALQKEINDHAELYGKIFGKLAKEGNSELKPTCQNDYIANFVFGKLAKVQTRTMSRLGYLAKGMFAISAAPKDY